MARKDGVEWMSHPWSVLHGFNDRQELFLLQMWGTEALTGGQAKQRGRYAKRARLALTK